MSTTQLQEHLDVSTSAETTTTVERYSRALVVATETVIEEQADAEIVAGSIRHLKDVRAGLVKERDAALDPIATALARIKSWFQPALDGIDAADKVYRAKLLDWNTKEADRVARERREAEAKEQAERQAAEKAARETREQAARDAAALRAAGQHAKANELVENAETAAATRELEVASTSVVVAAAAKAKGTGSRSNWSAVLKADETEITAIRKIVEAIRMGRDDLWPLLMINQPGANAKARLEKESFNVPGMKSTNNQSTIVR